MNRIQAVRALRQGTLSTPVFNQHTPYPFKVNVSMDGMGRVYSHLSYHPHLHPTANRVRLSFYQVLSFIRRNYPA
jgi:hypothetical protein